jgi:hypothetical protein
MYRSVKFYAIAFEPLPPLLGYGDIVQKTCISVELIHLCLTKKFRHLIHWLFNNTMKCKLKTILSYNYNCGRCPKNDLLISKFCFIVCSSMIGPDLPRLLCYSDILNRLISDLTLKNTDLDILY